MGRVVGQQQQKQQQQSELALPAISQQPHYVVMHAEDNP
jgi:hypothetical protein